MNRDFSWGQTTEQTLQPELKPGETLLWSGRPRGGLRLQQSDLILIPFSLMWGGFAIFWEVSVLFMTFSAPAMGNEPPLFRYIFPLFGIPFVCIGLYMIVGRFFFDAKNREKTVYGVTDQRVIIVTQLMGHRVRSASLSTLPELDVSVKPDASGTISFGGAFPGGALARNPFPDMPNKSGVRALSFEMLENVRSVVAIIQEAQQKTRA